MTETWVGHTGAGTAKVPPVYTDHYTWDSVCVPNGNSTAFPWAPNTIQELPVQPINSYDVASFDPVIRIGVDELLHDEVFVKKLLAMLLKQLGKEGAQGVLEDDPPVPRSKLGRRIERI